MAAAIKNVTSQGIALIFSCQGHFANSTRKRCLSCPEGCGTCTAGLVSPVAPWMTWSTEILAEWDVDWFHELEGCYKALERSLFFGSGTTLWSCFASSIQVCLECSDYKYLSPKGECVRTCPEGYYAEGRMCWMYTVNKLASAGKETGETGAIAISRLTRHKLWLYGISSKVGTQVFLSIGMLSQSIFLSNLSLVRLQWALWRSMHSLWFGLHCLQQQDRALAGRSMRCRT